jgi:hypothetical protein
MAVQPKRIMICQTFCAAAIGASVDPERVVVVVAADGPDRAKLGQVLRSMAVSHPMAS